MNQLFSASGNRDYRERKIRNPFDEYVGIEWNVYVTFCERITEQLRVYVHTCTKSLLAGNTVLRELCIIINK